LDLPRNGFIKIENILTDSEISKRLESAEIKARSSKLRRWLYSPVSYPLLLAFNKVVYPISKKGINVKARTFFCRPFNTLLPAGTDILLNGIKAHDSEIRLTRFLVNELKQGDAFIDVGAHYGYYSLLASSLVGSEGTVYAIEPSVDSFGILEQNTSTYPNIISYKKAVSDARGQITFYEYPGPYAEYNTTVKNAYADTPWIKHVKETVNRVETILLDDIMDDGHLDRATIKIDAEGGELAVLKGLIKSLKDKNLIVIMEYLESADSDSLHHQAVRLFEKHNYLPHAIRPDGTLSILQDIDLYLKETKLDSDNLVFVKM
jgi:FkbM family methyltransferase